MDIFESDPLQPACFEGLQQAALTEQIRVYPARSFAPSQIGHPCDRFLTMRFTHWEHQRPHSWQLESIFREGDLHAPSIYQRLEGMGFEVVRESDRPIQYRVGDAVLSGRPDGRIVGFRGRRFETPKVLELKTMASYTWDKIVTADDLKAADAWYLRGYLDQIYCYEFLDDLPDGVIVTKNKQNGLLRIIPVPLDFERAEWLLKRAEIIHGFVQNNVLPEPIPYDDKVCGGCPFAHYCYPPRDMGTGLQVLDDQQLLDDLSERDRLKPAADEFAALDKSIKARLKRLGIFDAAAIGSYLITRTEVPVKAYTVKARIDVRFTIEKALESTAARAVEHRGARISNQGGEDGQGTN
jgi:hypothetical protein